MFQVSDKVVCVDDSPPEKAVNIRRLIKGHVYVVSCIWACPLSGKLVLKTVGDSEHFGPMGLRLGWWAKRFRKLSDIQAENELARTISEPVTTKSPP